MARPEKIDLHKQHKSEYAAKRTPALVTVGPAKYLAIAGAGSPGGEDFQVRVGALYAVAFTVKMASKFAGRDYKVCGLEGLYWADEPGAGGAFDRDTKELSWKLLIRVPEFIDARQLDQAAEALREKGKAPEAGDVRLEALEEGLCVQMLHVGPYDAQQEALEAMSGFARDNGVCFDGRHHEIYLSDPRRVAPERLRTILRHPVRPL